MTLTATTNKVAYAGNGSTTSFAVTFIYWEDTTVKVILSNDVTGVETVWTDGTQYTLSGGDGAVGTLTVDISPTDYTPASGETLTVKSNHPDTQTSSLPLGGAFPSTTVEDRFDKNVRLVQQVQEEIDRTIKFPESSATSGVSITDLTALNILRVDSAGTGIENVSLSDLALGIYRGDWAASTAYVVRDIIKDTSNSNIYLCLTGHTSSGAQPISGNTDVAKWALIVDAAAAAASAAAAAADVILTNADVVLTNADVVSTNADVVSTNADVVLTNADVVLTGNDVTSTNADVVSTNADVISAAASFDSFDDRYLGAKSADPTLDNDGSALIDGALFFRTDQAVMKVYDLSTTTWLRTTPSSTDQAHINTVSGISANVTTVSGISANVTTVAGISANVTSVAGNSSNINSVASNATNINTTATNIASVNNFADVYRIAAADPSTSLTEGDLVFRTDSDTMRVYNGSAWQDVAPIVSTNVFNNITDGSNVIVADSTTDTLTILGTGATTVTNTPGTDTVTISSTAGASVGLVLALG